MIKCLHNKAVAKFKKRTRSKIFTTISVFLVITAVGLGYAIYQRQTLNQPQTTVEQAFTPIPHTLPTPAVDEELVLDFPDASSSKEEQKKHYDLVSQLAENVDYIDIGKCRPSPLVVRIKNKDPVTFKNSDQLQHSVAFNQEQILTIPAGGKESIIVNFEFGPGVYGYTCDAKGKAAGVILVI